MTDPFYQGTHITEPPTYAGAGGRAWRLLLPDVGRRPLPDHDATVGGFIVNAQGRHRFWDHWLVAVVHLRPIDGASRPAIKKFDAATHELMIYALDPDRPLPAITIGPDWHAPFLLPVDIAEQFTVADDATADRILELAVRSIVDGFTSPDSDWRTWWTSAIAATAAHFNDGTHVERLQ